MTFNDVLSQTIAMLQQHGRVSYRALKRQFAMDDDFLEDLKSELIEVQQRAVDQDGTMLVWTGDPGAAVAPMPAPSPGAAVLPPTTRPAQEPLAYTPAYLAEKILMSRSALEGERKQVTVLFADLKGSMELLADRDPEEARQLLDPVLERMMAAVHRYEGTVNQVMGDGIMALFGAPLVHKDHALRAGYAALAMQATIRAYYYSCRSYDIMAPNPGGVGAVDGATGRAPSRCTPVKKMPQGPTRSSLTACKAARGLGYRCVSARYVASSGVSCWRLSSRNDTAESFPNVCRVSTLYMGLRNSSSSSASPKD